MSLSIGIDSGSTATKGILFDSRDGGRIVRRFLVPTPFRPLAAIEQGWAELSADLPERPHLTLTGYGRDLASFADRRVTEISCHGLGARLLCPSVHTVIDIGGQDSKAISLDEHGGVRDFVMNDKCAAGTGRFLQNMAVLLEYSLEDFAEISRDTEPQPITNMCTVFAETEVISLLARGVPKSSIALGLLEAAASRAAAMVGRLSSEGALAFTGGAALNPLLAELIAKHSGREVLIPPQPQFAGAFGAALIAAQKNQ